MGTLANSLQVQGGGVGGKAGNDEFAGITRILDLEFWQMAPKINVTCAAIMSETVEENQTLIWCEWELKKSHKGVHLQN